jgi:hypothetical protein
MKIQTALAATALATVMSSSVMADTLYTFDYDYIATASFQGQTDLVSGSGDIYYYQGAVYDTNPRLTSNKFGPANVNAVNGTGTLVITDAGGASMDFGQIAYQIKVGGNDDIWTNNWSQNLSGGSFTNAPVDLTGGQLPVGATVIGGSALGGSWTGSGNLNCTTPGGLACTGVPGYDPATPGSVPIVGLDPTGALPVVFFGGLFVGATAQTGGLLTVDTGPTGLLDNATEINIIITGETVLPPSAVPVPAAAWLFGSALVGLAGIGRKRKMA